MYEWHMSRTNLKKGHLPWCPWFLWLSFHPHVMKKFKCNILILRMKMYFKQYKTMQKHLPNLWPGNFMHLDDTILMWTIPNAHVGGMYRNTSFQLWLCWHNSLGFLQAKSRQIGSFQFLESSSHFKGVGCTF